MLEAGSKAVWVVYPKTRKIQVQLPDGTSITRGVGDTLTLPQLAPGWEFPVAKLFED
jgi:Uma2 family endonuclease